MAFVPFVVAVRNYRCFGAETPAKLEFREDIAAIIGPNNAGKSALLRFFYEMRPLWTWFATMNPGRMVPVFRGEGDVSLGLLGIEDPTEVINSDSDNMSISITWEAQTKAQYVCTGLTLDVTRDSPTSWKANFRWHDWPTWEADRGRITGHQGIQMGLDRQSGGVFSFINIDDLLTVASTLRDIVYVPPFRNILNEGGQTHFDLPIGTHFVSTWDVWKTGPDKTKSKRVMEVEEDIRRVFSFRRFGISASSDKKTLHLDVNGKPLRLREIGAGLAQFVLVMGACIERPPSFLLIDEPELNLHASLQQDFVLRLAELARSGVIFGTHSVGLARSVADRILSVRPTERGSEVHDFHSGGKGYAELLGALGYTAYSELGFEQVLLVEGVTEVKVVQQWLRLYRKEHQIVVLPLGGAQLIAPGRELELGEIGRITTKVAVLIDSERQAAGAPLEAARETFVNDCTALGFKVHATERRATENYFTTAALQVEKGPKYKELGPYDKLNSAAPSWGKSENWRIARRMTASELNATDLGRFLASL